MYTQKAQCRSIAFPVFGIGNLEYPWDEVAKTMIDTINKYGRMNFDTTIREIKIVLLDKDIKSIQVNIV
jgi:O-acetyl-ADP-ribose deacetylase (regulator of RNase III)